MGEQREAVRPLGLWLPLRCCRQRQAWKSLSSQGSRADAAGAGYRCSYTSCCKVCLVVIGHDFLAGRPRLGVGLSGVHVFVLALRKAVAVQEQCVLQWTLEGCLVSLFLPPAHPPAPPIPAPSCPCLLGLVWGTDFEPKYWALDLPHAGLARTLAFLCRGGNFIAFL